MIKTLKKVGIEIKWDYWCHSVLFLASDKHSKHMNYHYFTAPAAKDLKKDPQWLQNQRYEQTNHLRNTNG